MDTLQWTVLGSGSKGNASVLQLNGKSLLIDAGFAYRNLKKRLAIGNIPIESIAGILVTHEHYDHIRSLGVFSRIHNIPVYVTEITYRSFFDEVKRDISGSVVFIEPEKSIDIHSIQVGCFPVMHDASDPVGFTFSSNSQKIGYITDIGSITYVVVKNLKDSALLVLEANHDKDMLWNGPYPQMLKERIYGPNGHMSNNDTYKLLKQVIHDNLKAVFLSHISKENNSPTVAYKTIHGQIAETCNYVPEIILTRQNEVSEPYAL